MKVILFANTDWYLYNFRIDFARALQLKGYEVVLSSPDGPYHSKLESMGFKWHNIPLSRRGINPIHEIRNIFQIMQLFQKEKPDIVHHFTIKCVFYGSTAAHLLGIKKIINSITGMGYVFTGSGLKKQTLRFLIVNWYRLVLRGTRVIIQNQDDMAFFVKEKIIKAEDAVLIAGSGVDINRFSPSPLPSTGLPLVVLASRMLYDKGIAEYVDAARHINRNGAVARFILIGNIDEGNPTAIPLLEIEEWQKEGVIEWWGWRDNMVEVYRQADIACLPSYREGLPKMLIEAGACGLPIVTTDISGCREVVKDGENGLLVPARDAEALEKALLKLIFDKNLRQEMGKLSREMVKSQFSVEMVINKTMCVYEEMARVKNG